MIKEDFISIGRRRYEEAPFALKKALRINPGTLSARIDLGALYEDQLLQVTPEDKHLQKRLERIS